MTVNLNARLDCGKKMAQNSQFLDQRRDFFASSKNSILKEGILFQVRGSDGEAEELTQRQVSYAANDALVGINVAIVMAIEYSDLKSLDETFDSLSDLVMNSEFMQILAQATFLEDLDSSLEFDKVKSRSKVDKKSLEYRLEHSRGLNKYAGIGKDTKRTRKKALYDNAELLRPDGTIQNRLSKGRAQWYVKQGKGEEVKQEPYTVRLFEDPVSPPEVDRISLK